MGPYVPPHDASWETANRYAEVQWNVVGLGLGLIPGPLAAILSLGEQQAKDYFAAQFREATTDYNLRNGFDADGTTYIYNNTPVSPGSFCDGLGDLSYGACSLSSYDGSSDYRRASR